MGKTSTPECPGKPYPDFPLHASASTGQWRKKIRGRLYSFGSWRKDPSGQEALAEYERVRDDLYAGRKPSPRADQSSVRDLVNRFLTDKKQLMQAGELSERTFREYKSAASRAVNHFGATRSLASIKADDFSDLRGAFPETWGMTAASNEINRIRVIFRYARQCELTDFDFIFGPAFRRASKPAQRRRRAAAPARVLPADVIEDCIAEASTMLEAMILLGINCGLGNSDCAKLTFAHLAADGWLHYPRSKTGIARRSPLWPETSAAIRRAIAARPDGLPSKLATRVFITSRRGPWEHTGKSVSCPISAEFRKVLQNTGHYEKGRSFYSLRHTCNTIADQSGDIIAVKMIMGHVDDSISENYRHSVDDSRLVAAAAHVRNWLWPSGDAWPCDV